MNKEEAHQEAVAISHQIIQRLEELRANAIACNTTEAWDLFWSSCNHTKRLFIEMLNEK